VADKLKRLLSDYSYMYYKVKLPANIIVFNMNL